MSKERLIKAMERLPKGFHAHSIRRFVNGNVRTTNKGTVNVPIEIPIGPLGSPFDDLRAVLSPEDNKLIPVLVFIDLDEVES